MESHTCVICLSDNDIDRIEKWECNGRGNIQHPGFFK